jgi:hypothetical protein
MWRAHHGFSGPAAAKTPFESCAGITSIPADITL